MVSGRYLIPGDSQYADRQLLAAPLVGRVASWPLLLAVLERTVHDGLDGLGRVRGAGLLEEAGDDAYDFVHDVVREVVETGLGGEAWIASAYTANSPVSPGRNGHACGK